MPVLDLFEIAMSIDFFSFPTPVESDFFVNQHKCQTSVMFRVQVKFYDIKVLSQTEIIENDYVKKIFYENNLKK